MPLKLRRKSRKLHLQGAAGSGCLRMSRIWRCGAVPCARPKRRMRGKKPLEKDEAEVQKQPERKQDTLLHHSEFTSKTIQNLV